MNNKTKKYLLFVTAMGLFTGLCVVLSKYRDTLASVPVCDDVIDCATNLMKIAA